MFTWLNKQGVKSKKGFIVQCTGRFTAEYREGDKKITIELESGILSGRKFCEIISRNAFVSWDDGSPITKEKQSPVFSNKFDQKASGSLNHRLMRQSWGDCDSNGIRLRV